MSLHFWRGRRGCASLYASLFMDGNPISGAGRCDSVGEAGARTAATSSGFYVVAYVGEM